MFFRSSQQFSVQSGMWFCACASCVVLLFFSKACRRHNLILISSFQKITFPNVRASLDDISQHEGQILDSITVFRTNTNGEK